MVENEQWRKAAEPLPVGAIRVSSGTCAYDCDKPADYLVKIDHEKAN